MFEDILRAAKKANGENFDKPPSYPMVTTPQYDAPKKWYEKKWGVGLMLIICFPLGAILLWQNPRYSNAAKGGITVAVVFLIFFVHNNYRSPEKPSSARQNINYTTQSTKTTETTEKTIYASSQRSCLCIPNVEDIDAFLSAAKRKDVDYIDAMLASGRAFVVRKNTRVLCSDSGIYEGIVFVTFLEGEHTGERAYTFKKRVQ